MVFQLRVVAGMPRRFSTTALEYVCGSVGVVAAPHPHERVRECLLENAAVAVARGKPEYEAVAAFKEAVDAIERPCVTEKGFGTLFSLFAPVQL